MYGIIWDEVPNVLQLGWSVDIMSKYHINSKRFIFVN